MRSYRQAHLDGHPLFVMTTIAVILYVFAGAFVYWLITGSGTVGEGGTVSNLGGLVWFGPLFAWWLVIIVGRRGPFRPLWLDPMIVSMSADRLSWRHGNGAGSSEWDAIGIIRPRLSESWRSNRYVVVAAVDGRVITKLPMWVTDDEQGRGTRRSLLDVIVAARPDLFRFDGGALRRGAIPG